MQTKLTQGFWIHLLALALAPIGAVIAADEPNQHDEAALLKALPNSKMSLADGIAQAAKSDGAPISAKFEFDDHGKLSLSVYTAEKGLTVAPAQNVLKELSGSPEQASWKPEMEVFKDAEHVTRASEHLSLLSGSSYSLVDFINKAQARAPGNALSITPTVFKGIKVALVQLAVKGKVVDLLYNLKTGELAGGSPPYGSREDD